MNWGIRTMTDNRKDHDGLDAFFSAARENRPALSDEALARMTAQALATQVDISAGLRPGPRTPRRGWIAAALATIGGWPAMAGLATAGVAGLWIGAVPPAGLVNLAVDLGAVTETAEDDTYLVDPLPGYTLSLDLTEAE